jgi:ParB family chromosome partitioning protein
VFSDGEPVGSELPADQQEQALSACFREDWSASGDRKAKRIHLPVRGLQFWIEQNVLLFLKDAPFDRRDAHLVVIAGSCVDCPKRTGHNKLLFSTSVNRTLAQTQAVFRPRLALTSPS